MSLRANWTSWVLQLLGGLVAGAFGGLVLIHRKHRPDAWMRSDCVPLFLAGCTFFGGGLASYLGDRLWYAGSTSMHTVDWQDHSFISALVSIVMMVVGGVLVVYALVRHFGIDA
jgi:H+/Cl- antiporter ClcA